MGPLSFGKGAVSPSPLAPAASAADALPVKLLSSPVHCTILSNFQAFDNASANGGRRAFNSHEWANRGFEYNTSAIAATTSVHSTPRDLYNYNLGSSAGTVGHSLEAVTPVRGYGGGGGSLTRCTISVRCYGGPSRMASITATDWPASRPGSYKPYW